MAKNQPKGDKGKAASQGMARAYCDYCGRALGCLRDSHRVQEYWQSKTWGLIACDECLPKISDDFPQLGKDDRLIALRLQWARGINLASLDAAIEEASGAIAANDLRKLRDERAAVPQLWRERELIAAVWAAQSLWNSVNHLHDSLSRRRVLEAGAKVIAGGKKGAEARHAKGPGKKARQILAAAHAYRGEERAKIATIARRSGSTPQYVGKVLKEIRNSSS